MKSKYTFFIMAFAGIVILGCRDKQSAGIGTKDSTSLQTSRNQEIKKENIGDISEDIPDDNDGRIKVDVAELFTDVTARNYPDYVSPGEPNIDFVIRPCRKERPKPILFPRCYKSDQNNIKDPSLLNYNEFSNDDKIYLYELATDTKDPKYLDLLLKLAQTDTLGPDIEIRVNLIKCLGYYKTTACKKILTQLLNDKDYTVATVAAICLVQINALDEAIDYFAKTYNYRDEYAEYVDYVYSALMFINTRKSIDLLQKFTEEQVNPGYTLDGLAALSLSGNCDYAFNGFKSFLSSELETIREKAVSCLAYYIGTPQAFDAISSLKNDESIRVRAEVEHVLKLSVIN